MFPLHSPELLGPVSGGPVSRRGFRPRAFGWSCRVLGVLLSLWVWLTCSSAQAATLAPPAADDGVDAAPMCDLNATSVAASPDMDLPLLDRGRFEELPCEALALLQLSYLQFSHLRSQDRSDAAESGAPDRPERLPLEVERVHYEAARTLPSSLPPRPTAVVSREPDERGLLPSPEHRCGVYRPPLDRPRV